MKWLSMSEAAPLTPYSAEYLSLLARKKKLTAKKVGNTWYTTKAILDEYMKRQMIRNQIQNGDLSALVSQVRPVAAAQVQTSAQPPANLPGAEIIGAVAAPVVPKSEVVVPVAVQAPVIAPVAPAAPQTAPQAAARAQSDMVVYSKRPIEQMDHPLTSRGRTFHSDLKSYLNKINGVATPTPAPSVAQSVEAAKEKTKVSFVNIPEKFKSFMQPAAEKNISAPVKIPVAPAVKPVAPAAPVVAPVVTPTKPVVPATAVSPKPIVPTKPAAVTMPAPIKPITPVVPVKAAVSATPAAPASLDAVAATLAQIADRLDKISQAKGLSEKVKVLPGQPNILRRSFGIVFGSKPLMYTAIALVVFFSVFPTPFVFGMFDSAIGAVKHAFTDATTVMGFRPGTHQNELLLLDKQGNISIMGHIETDGQFRSYAKDGIAPIVVDSKTEVKNLNSEMVGGNKATDFTLAYVTKNGNVTTEDVFLNGDVEAGKTLLVRGASKLLSSLDVDGGLSVLGDAKFSKSLTVEGPAYFSTILNAANIRSSGVAALGEVITTGNVSVGKNIAVRGSIEAGHAVNARSAAFGSAGISGDFSASGKITLGNPDDEIVINSKNATLDEDGNLTLRGGATIVGSLNVTGGFTGSQMTVSNLIAANASTTFLVAFESSTTNATTTSLFASVGHIVSGAIDSLSSTAANIATLAANSISVGALTATSSVITNATTTNASTTNSYVANLTVDNSTTTNQFVTNIVVANAAITQASLANAAISGAVIVNSTTTNATTTNLATVDLTATGKVVLPNAGSNMVLSTDASGRVVATSSPQVAAIFATSSSAMSTFAGGVTVGANTLAALQSGNVGIGTGTPADRLNVVTAAAVTGTNGSGYLRLVSSGGTNLIQSGLDMVNGSAAPLVFGTINNGAEWARFGSNGFLGINTNNPQSVLDVAGNIYSSNPASDVPFNGSTQSGSANFVGTNGYWALRTATNRSFNLDVYNGALPFTALTVLQNGNVGIGTTTPQSKLSLVGNANIGGDLFANNLTAANSVAASAFAATSSSATSTFAGYIDVGGVNSTSTFAGNVAVTGNLAFGNGIGTKLSISSAIASDLVPDVNITRNIGSPAFYWKNGYFDNINVNNISAASTTIAGTASNSFTINSDNVTADAEDMQLIFKRGTVTPNALIAWNSATKRFELNQPVFIQNQSNDDVVTLDVQGNAIQTTDLFRVSSTTGSRYLTVANNGNVGIGTTTPFARLSVAGDTYIGGNLTATGTFSVSGTFSPNVGNNTILSTNASGIVTGTSSPSVASIYVTSTTATSTFAGGIAGPGNFTVQQATGNVGIGTTSPLSLLSVQGQSPNGLEAMRIYNATTTGPLGGNSYIYFQRVNDTARGLVIGEQFVPATTTYVRSAGGVSQNLELQTGLDLSGNRGDIYVNPSGGNVRLGTTTPLSTAKSIMLSGISGQTANIFKVTDSLQNPFVDVTATGNVGIGTTSPFTRLGVAGDTYIGGNFTATGTSRLAGALTFAALPSCAGGQALQTDANGNVSCGSLSTGGIMSAGGWTTNGIGSVRLSTSTDLVGIGTSSPFAKLSVAGSAYIGGNLTATGTLAVTSSATIGGTLSAGTTTVTNLAVTNTSTSTFAGGITGPGNFTVTQTNGFVGIGTTSPQARLDVFNNTSTSLGNGDLPLRISSQGDNTYSGFNIYSPSNPNQFFAWGLAGSTTADTRFGLSTANGAFIFANGPTGQQVSKLAIGLTTDAPIYFANANTVRMTIASTTGNVGIGTTSPFAILSVAGDAYIGGNLTATGTISTTGSVSTGATSTASAFVATAALSTSTFAGGFSAAGSSGLSVLNSNGFVGIGKVASQRLDVLSSSNKEIATFEPGSSGAGDFSAGGVGWQFSRPTDGAMAHSIYSYTGTGGLNNFALSSRDDLVFQAGSGGPASAPERMRVQGSTGFVGIGTTTPGSKLEVVGGGVHITGATNPTKGGVGLELGYDGNESFVQSYNRNSSSYVPMYYNASTHVFNNGNVGIGTTTPSNKLTIIDPSENAVPTDTPASWIGAYIQRTYTSSSAAGLAIQGSTKATTGEGRLFLGNADEYDSTYIAGGSGIIRFQTRNAGAASSEVMRIAANGNVGIGTSTPTVALDVNGAAARIMNTNGNAAQLDLVEAAGGHDWAMVSWGSSAGGGTLPGKFSIYDNTSGGNRLTIDTSGNVGINNTNPNNGKLAVTQSTDSSVGGITVNNSAVSNDLHLWVDPGSSGLGHLDVRDDFSRTLLVNAGGTGGLGVGYSVAAPSAGAIIQGNVGIGTTTPDAKLNVFGATGGLLVNGANYRGAGLSSVLGRNGNMTIGDTYFKTDYTNVAVLGAASNDGSPIGLAGYALGSGARPAIGAALGADNTSTGDAIGLYIKKLSATGGGSTYSIYDESGAKSYFSGNVGIGTTTPTVKLSVGAAAGDTTGHGYFTGGLGIGVVNTNPGTVQTSGAITSGGNLNVAGDISLTNAGAAAIRETGGGYLVVGTTANNVYLDPASQLYIRPAGGHTAMTVSSGASVVNYLDVLGANTGSGPVISAQTTGSDTNIPINISGKGTGAIVLNGSGTGNVGIGTTNPANAKLQIAGTSVGIRVDNPDNTNFLVGYGNSGARINHNIYVDGAGQDNEIMYNASGAATNSFTTSGSSYFNGGNVGIGTTSPAVKFQVYGSNPDISLMSSASTRDQWRFRADDATQRLAIVDDTSGFGEVMSVSRTGNVGIGSTSPNSILSVANGRISIGSAGAKDRTDLTGGSGFGSRLSMFEATNGTETVRLDAGGSGGTSWINAGNVGIGTSSPGSLLQVEKTQHSATRMLVRNDDTTTSDFNTQAQVELQVGGSLIGGIKSTAANLSGLSTKSLYLTTEGAYPVVIGTNQSASPTFAVGATSGGVSIGNSYISKDPGAGNMVVQGNVGVGTTSPNIDGWGNNTTVLTVQGQNTSSSGGVLELGARAANSTSGNYVGVLDFTADSASNKDIAQIQAILSGSSAGNLGGALKFFTKADGGSTLERMRIDNGGNVGIGTTTPQAKLHVASSQFGSEIRLTDSGIANADWSILPQTTNVTPLFRIYNRTTATDALDIQPGGNVGIGTTGPNEKLEINGNIQMPGGNYIYVPNGHGLNFADKTDEITTLAVRGTASYGGRFDIYTAGNSTVNASINSNGISYLNGGNVGIGTTTPQGALSVAQTVNGSNAGIMVTGPVDNVAVQLGNFSTGGKGWWLDSTGGASGFGQGNLVFGTANSANNGSFATPLVTFQSGGNVGVGTTNPYAIDDTQASTHFHVKTSGGTGNVEVARFEGGSDADNTYGVVRINHNNDRGLVLKGGRQVGNTAIGFVNLEDNVGTELPGITLLQNVSDTAANVGIGTTTPATKLGINGTGELLRLEDSASSNVRLSIGTQNNGGSNQYGYIQEYQNNTGTPGVSPLVFNPSGGNVGIGSTSPSTKLVVYSGASGGTPYGNTQLTVESSGRSIIQMLAPNNQDEYLMFGSPAASNRAFIGYLNPTNATPDQMTFQTSGSFAFNGGNVGIGTTSPSRPLQVVGIINSTGSNGGFQLNNRTTNLPSSQWYSPTSGETRLYDEVALTDRMTINSSGNVGIGTTNPGQLLDVSGTTGIRSDITSGGGTAITARQDGTGYNFVGMNGASNVFRVTATGGTIIDNNANENALTVNKTGSGYAALFNGGNVGIGTTNPPVKLDVTSGLTGDIAYFIGVGSRGAIVGTNEASAYTYLTTGNGSTGLALGINGDSPKVFVNTSGNVGIGTTSPSTKFAVGGAAGDTTGHGYFTGGLGVGVVNTTAGTIQTSGGATIGGTLSIPANTWMTSNTPTNILRDSFFGYSSTYRAVQIGSNSSTRAISLGVDLTGNASNQFSGNEIVIPNNVGIIAPNAANNSYLSVIGVDSSNKIQIGKSNFALFTSGGYMTIDTSGGSQNGNVGIGTTTPTEKLTITNNGSYAAVSVGNGTNYSYFGYAQNATNYTNGSLAGDAVVRGVNGVNIAGGNGGAIGLRIDSSGNVGIGTTTPTAGLTFQGLNNSSGALFASNTAGAADISGSFFRIINGDNATYANAGALLYVKNAGNRGTVGNGSGSNLFRADFSNATAFIIDKSGNVGIGTSSPSSLLTLSGPNTTAPTITLVTNNTNTANGAIKWSNQAGTVQSAIGNNFNKGDSNGNLEFMTGGTANTRMIIDSTGNVGIGTSSPLSKLVVSNETSGQESAIHINSLNSVPVLRFQQGGTSKWGILGEYPTSGKLTFYDYTGIGSMMTLQTGGNVGMGTSTPAQSLVLDSSGGHALALTSAAGGDVIMIGNRDSAGVNAPATVSGANGSIYIGHGSDWYSSTAGTITPALLVNQSGGVSIGTYAVNSNDPGTSNLIVSGSVGIGTLSAVGKLTVSADNVDNGDANHTSQMVVNGSSDPNQRLLLGYNTTSNNGFIQSFKHHTGATNLVLQALGGNMGVGTTSPFTKLSVAGNGWFDGTVLASNFRTDISNNTFAGASAGNTTLTSSGNTAFGSSALTAVSSGYQNTAVGVSALAAADFSYQNTAVGYQALAIANGGSAGQNTAVGVQALYNNTSGNDNSALGLQALYNNTTGYDNNAFGATALNNNTTGRENSAVGYAALGRSVTGMNNVAIGGLSSYNNVSATSTVAVGVNAARGTGVYNNQNGVYLGYQAGYSASTGSNANTLIGYQAGYSLSTGSYNIAIGQNVDLPSNTGSQQLNIGNLIYGTGLYNGGSVSSTAVAGSVGIATSTPSMTFSVFGPTMLAASNSGQTDLTLYHTDGAGAANDTTMRLTANANGSSLFDGYGNKITFAINGSSGQNDVAAIGSKRDTADNSGALVFYTANSGSLSERMRVAMNGNVGIGTSSPGSKVQIAADSTYTGAGGEQLRISGASNDNQRLALGYNTNTDVGFIEAYKNFGNTSNFKLVLNPEGGSVGIATSTAVSTLTVSGSGCFSQGAGVASIACGTAAGNIYYKTANPGNYDVAENYAASDPSIGAGDIVALDATASSSAVVRKATEGSRILGIVSTDPGMVLGGSDPLVMNSSSTRPVALSGRVPVKVNGEAGDIAVGDKISLSSVPGVGKKARGSEETVGTALESWSGGPLDQGIIMVFVSNKQSFDQSQFSIDGSGNVGIGTTTPLYKMQVNGDIAANAFVNVSTRSAKKDISYLDDAAKLSMLDKLKTIGVATYRYNTEDETAPLRMGLIAEEAPAEVLADTGKGVDVYKLSTFILSGVQELSKKFDDLATKVGSNTSDIASLQSTVSDLQAKVAALSATSTVVASGTTTAQTVTWSSDFSSQILAFFEAAGLKLSNGVAYIKNAMIDSITATTAYVNNAAIDSASVGALSVGSAEKRTGITLYDQLTGDPYCLQIAGGQTRTQSGVCSAAATSTPVAAPQGVSADGQTGVSGSFVQTAPSGAAGTTTPSTVENPVAATLVQTNVTNIGTTTTAVADSVATATSTPVVTIDSSAAATSTTSDTSAASTTAVTVLPASTATVESSSTPAVSTSTDAVAIAAPTDSNASSTTP